MINKFVIAAFDKQRMTNLFTCGSQCVIYCL